MADKKILPEVLRSPECIDCFENINTHANYVFGMFEVKSAEAMEKQDEAFTKHLKVQDAKYDVFLERADKRDSRRSGANMLILGLFASVIAYSYVQQRELENTVIKINNEKADRKEVPTMNDIKQLRDLGDQYNRSVFVRKEIVSSDTSAYFWSKKNIYGSELRGAKKWYKEDYDKAIKDSKN